MQNIKHDPSPNPGEAPGVCVTSSAGATLRLLPTGTGHGSASVMLWVWDEDDPAGRVISLSPDQANALARTLNNQARHIINNTEPF